jgi:hypothetical protein
VSSPWSTVCDTPGVGSLPHAVNLLNVIKIPSCSANCRRSLAAARAICNVTSSSWSRDVSRVARIVTGAILVMQLVGGLTFIGMQLTQHPKRASPQPSTQRSPSTAVSPASIGVVIPGCYNPSIPPADRPAKLNIVGCASTAVALEGMSWSSWAPQGAEGTGTAVFKTCQPNCATGYQLTNQVVVHAWNPQPPQVNSGCPAGLNVFADMIFAFPQGAPPPAVQELNTHYKEMPAVHYTNYSVATALDGEFIGYTFCQ